MSKPGGLMPVEGAHNRCDAPRNGLSFSAGPISSLAEGRAPNARTGGLEKSCPRLGTDGSNPSPSSAESCAKGSSLPQRRRTIGEGVCFGEATRERDPVFLAGFGSATTSFPPSTDFAAERDLRPHAGVACESLTTSTGVGAGRGVTAGSTTAFGLRPSPRAFANVERRSE